MENVHFDKILSTETHYGIIWLGNYKDKDSVIKMVLLNTGTNDKNSEIFSKNSKKPLKHKLFKGRKSMSISDFKHEVKMLKEMHKRKLAPAVYLTEINTETEAHYGFIVMERMHCTVKEVLLKRDLKQKEIDKILYTIKLMHELNICHGDCKPSNIGVMLNEKGIVHKIRFLDLAKGYSTSSSKARKHDIETFWEHVKKNVEIDRP